MPDFRSGQILTAERLNDIVSPGTELIEEINLSSDEEFTGIPQDYTHLWLVMWGGMDADGGDWIDIGLRINDDSGSDYNWWRSARVSDESFDEDFQDGDSEIAMCRWGGVTTRNVASALIASYTVNNWQSVQCNYTGIRGAGGSAGNHQTGQVLGYREVTEAITHLRVFPTSDDFAVTTIASLYGLR